MAIGYIVYSRYYSYVALPCEGKTPISSTVVHVPHFLEMPDWEIFSVNQKHIVCKYIMYSSCTLIDT